MRVKRVLEMKQGFEYGPTTLQESRGEVEKLGWGDVK
jgi:hypothetical protein